MSAALDPFLTWNEPTPDKAEPTHLSHARLAQRWVSDEAEMQEQESVSEMSSRSTRWVMVVAVALFGTGLCAQKAVGQKFDPWGEATVAAAFEHDLAKAAKIYEDIAGNPKETAEMQTKALLELGKVLRKAGMIVEAKAALKQASEGRGVAAKEAVKLLSAGTQDPDLLQVKVEKLIGMLRIGQYGANDDLLWIGKPAVPYVVTAVDNEKANLKFITRASHVLFRMGGKAVEDWGKKALKYPDVLKRRAVVQGFYMEGQRPDPSLIKVSPTLMQGFLEDKEASVRRDAVALRSIVCLVPAERVIALLKDPSPAVVSAARKSVQAHWRFMTHGDRRDENLAQLIEIFDKSGWALGMTPVFTSSQNGSLLFLRSLRRRVLENRGATVGRVKTQPRTPSAAELKEIMTTADALGMAICDKRAAKPAGWQAKDCLGDFVKHGLSAWDHNAMPVVLKLVSLNYGPSFHIPFEDWLVNHARASDIPAIAQVLRWMNAPYAVLYWMTQQKVPGTALKALTEFVDWLHGVDWDRSIPFWGSLHSVRITTAHAIAVIGTTDAHRYLISLIQREPGASLSARQKETWQKWQDAAFAALRNRGDDQTMRTLTELLVTPGDSKRARQVRYGAFQTLAALQADPAVDRYAKAYQLGFEQTKGIRSRGGIVTIKGQRLRAFGGLRLIVESRGAAPVVRNGRPPYSDETLAKIFDTCLATGKLSAFQDATYGLWQMAIPEQVATSIARWALKCPDKQPDVSYRDNQTLRQLLVWRLLDRYPNVPGMMQLIREALQDQDPEIRRLALGHINTPHVKDKMVLDLMEKCLRHEKEIVVEAACDRLFEEHPESLIARKDYLLGYKNSSVQQDVAVALLNAEGADAIPTVGKLLQSSTELRFGHRLDLLTRMARFRDMRAVPFLLEALKDKNESVRKMAEQELKSIRFYNEQERLWKRLMNGTDMSAASAAEALVKQASQGSTKDVRLTAIQSLGTLGKAETLPFLVKLMSDEDPDIRKAAKAAADRINAAKAKTKAGGRK